MSFAQTSGQFRPRNLVIWLFVISFFIFHNEVILAQTLASSSYPSRILIFTTISEPAYQGIRRFSEYNPLFKNKIPGLKKTIDIETETNTVTIQQKLLDTDFKFPVTLSFEEYLNLRYQSGQWEHWRGYVNKNLLS